MKKLLLLFSILLCSTIGYSQSYYMTGRFTNASPDISQQIDSAIFVFTSTEYSYYTNTNTNPSSFGTYYVMTGGLADTLVLMEDSLGICSVNGSGTTVKFKIDRTVTPYYSITLTETAASQDSCPSNSLRMSGDFLGEPGMITDVPVSVKTTNGVFALAADIYNGTLRLKSDYDEKAQIDVININGQKVSGVQTVTLKKGQTSFIPLDVLNTGVYFVRIKTSSELKVVKFAL